MTIGSKVVSSVGHLVRYPPPLSVLSIRHLNTRSDVGPDRLLKAASPVAVDLDGVVTLRMEGEGLGAREPVSCYTAIRSAVEKHHSKLAWVDQERKWTYEQYFNQVCILILIALYISICQMKYYILQINNSAKALIELGLEPNRSVAVLGNNSPEWFSCAVGAVFAGL